MWFGHLDNSWSDEYDTYFSVSEAFGIFFLMEMFAFLYCQIKFPMKDDFMKRAGWWLLVALSMRTFLCLASEPILCYIVKERMIFTNDDVVFRNTVVYFTYAIPYYCYSVVLNAVTFMIYQMSI